MQYNNKNQFIDMRIHFIFSELSSAIENIFLLFLGYNNPYQ